MMTFEAIGRELGISPSAAFQLYCTAMRKLRKRSWMVENMRGLADLLQAERRERVKGGLSELRELSSPNR